MELPEVITNGIGLRDTLLRLVQPSTTLAVLKERQNIFAKPSECAFRPTDHQFCHYSEFYTILTPGWTLDTPQIFWYMFFSDSAIHSRLLGSTAGIINILRIGYRCGRSRTGLWRWQTNVNKPGNHTRLAGVAHPQTDCQTVADSVRQKVWQRLVTGSHAM